MRPLFLSIVLVAALAVPVAANADTPPPAVVAACQAEYQQLGKDAFVAKYGPTEPFGHCYQQHASQPTPPTTTDNPALAACKAEYLQLGPDAFAAKYGKTETLGTCVKAHGGTQSAPTQTATAPPPPVTENPAVAACKAEYLQLGPDAFAAKYGKTETLGTCVKAHGGTQPTQPTPQPTQNGDDGASSVAAAFCQSQLKTLGKDAFAVTYGGKEAMGSCLKAALISARALVASCKSSSGASTTAFKACIAAGLSPKRR